MSFFLYSIFFFICFSNNVTHPEQDVCILRSPCSSALFPSGRCLPARGDYLSESSRCRAAGITHGVRFEKGGGRPESVLCLQLFISPSLIYFFLSSLSSAASAPHPGSLSSLLLALTPGPQHLAETLRAVNQPSLRCPMGAKESPTPRTQPAEPVPSPRDPPLPTLPATASSARSAVAHFHSPLAQFCPCLCHIPIRHHATNCSAQSRPEPTPTSPRCFLHRSPKPGVRNLV